MKHLDVAKSLVGKHFNQGQKEQCMNFVRHCLRSAGHYLADKIAREPVDGLWTGLGMASSLASREFGHLELNPDKLKPGSILFWNDTYDGDWPLNTITHVGIYEGLAGHSFIHRPTAARPVERAYLKGFWREQLRCGLIVQEISPPKELTRPNPPEPSRFKIFLNQRGFQIKHKGDTVPSAKVEILADGDRIVFVVDGKVIKDPKFATLEIVY